MSHVFPKLDCAIDYIFKFIDYAAKPGKKYIYSYQITSNGVGKWRSMKLDEVGWSWMKLNEVGWSWMKLGANNATLIII